MKQVWIEDRLHKTLSNRAKRENRKLYELVGTLLDLGRKEEKRIAGSPSKSS